MSQYPNLKYLIDCYFHQSWDHEFDSVTDLISYFCTQETEETVEGTIREMRQLIAQEGDGNVAILLDAISAVYPQPSSEAATSELLEEIIEAYRKRMDG